ncbi:hypothetical protein BGZ76_000092 [Entomortierella beljakovae]|nr:hypothetical protein BGZ76_000092 [Entomortierella beljakovae]
MTSPPPRKSSSRSPPILPKEFLTPAPPTNPQRTEKSASTSSSDIGVIRLSDQISQNDERLPKQAPHLRKQRSDSEGVGSASGSSNSIPELPYLDESPANYPVGHPYVQGSVSSTSKTIGRFHENAAQSMETLSYHHDMSASMPDSGPETETSFSHHSSHSENASFSAHNTSDESGVSKSNSSFGTNTSGSMNSRSSESQVSELSFTNAETSTPRATPIRNIPASQKSTPSDSDQNFSPPQISPISRAQYQRRRQTSVDSFNRSSSSQSKSISTIPEDEVLDATDTQQTEVFGTDPSLEEVEEAILEAEESHQSITDHIVSEADDALIRVESTPLNDTEERDDGQLKGHKKSKLEEFEYLSSDEDEASRSTLMSARLDLNISQSQANIIVTNLTSKSRKSSGSSSRILSRESSSVSTAGTTTGMVQNESVAVTTSDATTTDVITATTKSDDSAEGTKNVSSPKRRTSELAIRESDHSVSDSQEIPDLSAPEDPPSPSARKSSKQYRQSGGILTSPPYGLSSRSPRRNNSTSQDLPSSQSSSSPPLSSSDSVMMRLRSAASQDGNPDHIFSAVPKRRRPNEAESSPFQVISSVGEEGEFWEGTDKSALVGQERKVRSRSGSYDIFSYPEEYFPEEDADSESLLGNEEGGTSQKECEETEEQATSPAYSLRSSSQSQTLLQRPRTSQSRELRRRGSTQTSPSSTPTRRTLRRLNSTTEALRAYRINESVWARWRSSYYAGTVESKDSDFYGIHFADDDHACCDATHMRPLRLRLGAEVMAPKTENTDRPATVEGIHTANKLEQSRIDIRFEDDTEANLSIRQIRLTEDMMVKLDKNMNWEQESGRLAIEETPSVEEIPVTTITRQTSSVSAPSGTPRKNKAKLIQIERSLSGPLTPSRRSRTDKLTIAGLSSPSRKGARATKITAGGGTILDDFSSVLDAQRRRTYPNLFLIASTTVRTQKYLQALATNTPRVSFRWIEYCTTNRQLIPYHSYMLPTGLSKELGTIVSSHPLDDRGIFNGMELGFCGSPSFRQKWERIIKGAGAKVVPVTVKSGPKNCNFIIFGNPVVHENYCAAHTAVPSLTSEWLIQCLINQRVMAINGHVSYTTFEKLDDNQDSREEKQGKHDKQDEEKRE